MSLPFMSDSNCIAYLFEAEERRPGVSQAVVRPAAAPVIAVVFGASGQLLPFVLPILFGVFPVNRGELLHDVDDLLAADPEPGRF